MKPRKELWSICERFIQEHKITCPETVWQTDRVIEDAYEFIEEICDVVGYHEYETDGSN